jgi:tetratricopeptide (TPR) repeat protein
LHYAVTDELSEVPSLAEEALTLLPRGEASWFTAVAALTLAGAYDGNLLSMMKALEAYQSHHGRVPATGRAGLASWVLYGCLIHGGQSDTAQALMDRLENEEEQIGMPDPAFTAYLCIVRAFSSLFAFNDLGVALPNATRALRLSEEVADQIGQCLALYILGWAQIAVGEIDIGEETCQRGLERSRNVNFSWAENRLTLVLASGQLVREQPEAASASLQPLLQSSDTFSTYLAQVYQAMAFYQKGDQSEALRLAEIALKNSSIFPTIHTQALAILARIELSLNQFGPSIEHGQKALEMSKKGGINCIFEPMLRLTLSQALEAQGRSEEAREALKRARDYLLKQAASLYDSSQRDTYLERSFESARVLDLARQWFVN